MTKPTWEPTASRPIGAADATIGRSGRPQITMEAIADENNLLRAIADTRTMRSSGTGRITAVDVKNFPERFIPMIRSKLLSETWEASELKRIWVEKGPGKDDRPIDVTTTLDHIVQRAMLNIIYPVIDPTFSERSWGFRPGRSTAQLVLRVREEIARENLRYVAEIDLRNFFHSIPRGRLFHLIEDRISDRRVTRLVQRFVKAGVCDTRTSLSGLVHQGVPQGAALAPWLANVYLDQFDQRVEGWPHLLWRYADDLILLTPSWGAANRAWERARKLLEKNLRLEVHPLGRKSRVGKVDELTFVGFRLRRQDDVVIIEPSKAAVKKFETSVSVKRHDPKQFHEYVQSWHASYAPAVTYPERLPSAPHV